MLKKPPKGSFFKVVTPIEPKLVKQVVEMVGLF